MKNIPRLLPIFVTAVVVFPSASHSPSKAAPLTPTDAVKTAPPVAVSIPRAIPLEFRDFFESTPRELKLSDALRRLDGKRVQITGFIAHLEIPPQGAFFLCSRPVSCDEAGGGTADLPPETIRVIVRGAGSKAVQSIPRPVVVTGILQIGNRTEADGTTSSIRLILDRPQKRPVKTKAAAVAPAKPLSRAVVGKDIRPKS